RPSGLMAITVEVRRSLAVVMNSGQALACTNSDPRLLVIRLRRVPFVDVTGLQMLEDVIVRLQRRGVRVVLVEANARVRGKLSKARITDLIGADAMFDTLGQALAACLAAPDQAMPANAARP